MIINKQTFWIGIFLFLIPFLGLPTSWRTFLVIVCALILVYCSVRLQFPKKTARRRTRREKVTPVYVENLPIYRESSSESPEHSDTVTTRGEKSE